MHTGEVISHKIGNIGFWRLYSTDTIRKYHENLRQLDLPWDSFTPCALFIFECKNCNRMTAETWNCYLLRHKLSKYSSQLIINSIRMEVSWERLYTSTRVQHVKYFPCHSRKGSLHHWTFLVTNYQPYVNKQTTGMETRANWSMQTCYTGLQSFTFALSRALGRVVRKPVNVNPGFNVNCSITFSCLKMFFTSNTRCSLRLLQLKTEEQTI